MKKLPDILLLIFAVGALAPLARGSADRWETLQAINWVENPTNHTHYGSKGELGPYQFRPQTWRLHTRRPFIQAVQRDAADEVAVKHFEWISRQLDEAGIDANPYNIALVWNCGLTAVKRGRIPRSTYRYAEQVSNLVEMLKRRERGVATDLRVAVATAAPAPEFKPSLDLALDVPLPSFRSETGQEEEPRFVLAEPTGEEEIPVVKTNAPELPVASERPVFAFAAMAAPQFTLFR